MVIYRSEVMRTRLVSVGYNFAWILILKKIHNLFLSICCCCYRDNNHTLDSMPWQEALVLAFQEFYLAYGHRAQSGLQNYDDYDL